MPLFLRSQKGSALTHVEMDLNFISLAIAPALSNLVDDGYPSGLIDSIANYVLNGVLSSNIVFPEHLVDFQNGYSLGFVTSDNTALTTQLFSVSSLNESSLEFVILGVKSDGYVESPSYSVGSSSLNGTNYDTEVSVDGSYNHLIFAIFDSGSSFVSLARVASIV
jgi:hypothetical protein